jgi:hypothetical protein
MNKKYDVVCFNPKLNTMICYLSSILEEESFVEIPSLKQLAQDNLDLAMRLTSKPYINSPWR